MSHPPSSRAGTKPPGGWEPPTLETMQALLPQYEFVCLLGRGGMGAVYKARQVSLDRHVAIKVLPGDLLDDRDVNFMQRFEQEARTMARMNHPAIVGVFDFGETQGGLLYFVMEFVDGTDVSQMIVAQRRLPPEYALAIAAHVCDALAYAHGHGVVHRDIKPANILINMEGQVKVADFGLAKAHDTNDHGLTKTNVAMGTPDFVAPEALMHGVTLDGRADLYAIGVMLYQMLTGEIPRGMWQMPSLRVGTDARFDAIIAKAMQSDRELRYQTSQEIRQDLDRILAMPRVQSGGQSSVAIPKQAVAAKPVTQGPRAPQPRKEEPAPPPPSKKKSKSGLMMALGFSAVSCVIIALVINASRKPAEEPATAASAPPGITAPAVKAPTPKKPPAEVAAKPPAPAPPKTQPPHATPAVFSASAPQFSGKAQDLLPRVDLEQDVVVGTWLRKGEELVLTKRVAGENARFELPAFCSGSYLIEMEFTPGSEMGDFALHLPFAPEPGKSRNDVTLRLALGNRASAPVGFEFFGGKGIQSPQAPATATIEPLKTGRNQLLARVQLKDQGRIALALWFQGRPLLEWEGTRGGLSGSAIAWRPEHAPRFAIGTHSLSAIIHRVRVEALDGEVQWFREAPLAVATMPPPVPVPAPAPAADPVAIRLHEIEKQFQEAYEKQVGAVHKAAVADLNAKYMGALDRSIAAASQASKLDEALALRAEKALIQSQGGIPAEDAAEILPSLKTFRETYRKAMAASTANRDKAAEPLHAAYDRALSNYQDELTRAQKLDEAQRVKAVREHVSSQRNNVSVPSVSVSPVTAGSATAAASSSSSSKLVAPTAPPLPADKVLPPLPKATAEEVRALVTWCLEVKKGNVRVLDNNKSLYVTSMDELPKGKLSLISFNVYEMDAKGADKKWFSIMTRIPELEWINFSKNPGTFPMEELRSMTAMKNLRLAPEAVDDAAFAHLTGLKQLEKLTLTYWCKKFDGTGLGYINENLLELETDSKSLSAEGLAYLARFKKLRRLSLGDCTGLTDDMLLTLAALPDLEELHVGDTKLTGAFLAHLPANSKLTRLNLEDMTAFKAEHLPLLSRLKNLESLTLPPQNFTPADMAVVAGLPKLKMLWIENNAFTGEGFAGVKGFGSLTELHLSRCPITDSGWEALAGAVPDLKVLFFGRYNDSKGPFSAAAFGTHLAKLRNLTRLSFEFTGINDAWLVHVASLKNLTEISLQGTGVTDAVVPILKSLPKLEKTHTAGTQLTDQGRAELRKKLGN